jgi:hypothetical protein
MFFRKNDLEKSLDNIEHQLSSIERAVKSLKKLNADSGTSGGFNREFGKLRLQVQTLIRSVEKTRVLETFYLTDDRAMRLLDDKNIKSTIPLVSQLTTSFDSLWSLGKNLDGVVVKANSATSLDERTKYIDILEVTVSGLKVTHASRVHGLKEVMKLSAQKRRLTLFNGVVNAILYATIARVVLAFVPRSLVNLPEWFLMLVIFIVAIGIFISCLRGKPPKIAVTLV